MTERYKSFPPGRDNFRIPISSRRAALAGLSLYAACRPAARWWQRAAWLGVALLGPRVLPGRASAWRAPMDDAQWRELCERWGALLGPFDAMAVYQRRQASRPGLALLLLRRGRPVAFVKLRGGDGASVCEETRAHTAAWRFRPRSFSVPEPLCDGETGEWHWFATAPFPVRLHAPATDPPLDAIVEEVDAALGTRPRPPETPEHWRPMHGDFTPWNLRRIGRDAVVLVDWERAGWGPPRADHVLYEATRAALRGRPAARSDATEAIRFWRQRVAAWPATDADHAFTLVLQARLREMEGAS